MKLAGRVILLLVLGGTLVPVPAALAQADVGGDARAQELYGNGAILYEEGRYEDAIVAWEKAYELSPKPLLLYNIANALERIGAWQEALDTLNRYRALAPARERATLERRMRSIEQRLSEKRRRDEVDREAAARAAAERERLAPPRAVERISVGPGTAAVPARPVHPGPVLLMSLGLGGVVAGGIAGGVGMSARVEASTLCLPHGTSVLCPAAAAAVLKRDQDFSLASDIGIGAGSILAATGLVLGIIDATRGLGKRSARVRIIPAGGPGHGSVVLAGRF